MGVIYVRPNLINGKKYVGQATNLKTRQNKWKSTSGHYAGKAIDAARKKYGIDNFGFEILKECKDDELDYWEKYYIKELNTKVPYGYNMTDGGEGMTGYTHSQETKKKLSEARKGIPNIKLSKPVLQIDMITNEIIAEFPSIREVERQLGYSQPNISKCCKGK